MDVFSTNAEFLDVNCYAVRAEGRSDCILIDSGYDCAPRLEKLLAEEGLVPQAIFLTHGHPDHILGLNNVLARWNVPVHLGAPTGTGWRTRRRRSARSSRRCSPRSSQDWNAPEVRRHHRRAELRDRRD
jgi:hydroxyacylglutathione hydrolase